MLGAGRCLPQQLVGVFLFLYSKARDKNFNDLFIFQNRLVLIYRQAMLQFKFENRGHKLKNREKEKRLNHSI